MSFHGVHYARSTEGETSFPLKVMEDHQKVVVLEETLKSGMADHVQIEKHGHQTLWNEIKIPDNEQCWRVKQL